MDKVDTVGAPTRGRRSRRLGVLGELITFMWQNKLWWMIPIILVLLLFTAAIMVTQTAILPVIYPLF